MANNIGIIPGVIAGNLLVGGNVTVNGGQLLIKSASYYHRLGRLSGGQDGLSVNLQTDTNGPDDNTLAGWSQTFQPSATQARAGGTIWTPAFGTQIFHRGAELSASTVKSTVTGAPGLYDIFQFGLRAYAIGGGGNAWLRLTILFHFLTVVGGSCGLNLNIAGNNYTFFNYPANTAGDMVLKAYMFYDSTNAKWRLMYEGVNGASAPIFFEYDVIADPTVNQTITFKVQTGLAADSFTIYGYLLEQPSTH